MADLAAFESDIQTSGRPGDGKIAALAACQHGVVAGRQLVESGIGRGAIKHRVAAGRLRRVHLDVYAVGHAAIGPKGRLMAAVLASGDHAVLSHQSAAWVWGFHPPPEGGAQVTVPGGSRRGCAGIVVHRARRLDPEDRALRDGIPLTAVARTLLDLAEVLSARRLARALEEAERLRLFDKGAIDRLLRHSRGRQGLRQLHALFAEMDGAPPPTRSELERRFLALCRHERLPLPGVNIWLAGFEVDALWREQRLVVELDGYAFHGARVAFERDRVRDAALQLAGYRVLRVTHRRLEAEPGAVAEAVRALLEGAPCAPRREVRESRRNVQPETEGARSV